MEGDIPVFTTGDVNAFEYGGGILYYQPEYDEMLWVFWDEPPEDAEEGFPHYVYMFRWTPGEDLLKSEFSWVKEKDIESICSSMDCDPDEFRRWARGNVIEQLMVAENVRGYWGAQNLDHDPLHESEHELRIRYGKDLDKAAKNNTDKAIRIVKKARRQGKKMKSKNPARSAYDNMAWHHDMQVRDVYSEIDDRSLDEIAESIMEVHHRYDRPFEEPYATEHMTKDEAADSTIFASHIVDWANYGTAYGDYSDPPWERIDKKKLKQLKNKLLR